MNKKLAWLSWLPLSAVSPLALALGLGQATVNSPLQAPLDASVPLIDATGVSLDGVRVDIADRSAFDALGLEWTPLAASVRAELQRLPSGARLLLRSEQAVNEPWLDLLVTITTPDGRRTEALTLLFDPPNYAASTSPAATASSAAVSSPASASTPLPATRPASAARDIAYVASGDTLWGVAARVKPADVSVQQMMVALVEANPAAFPNGNVDQMRAGQTLAVPSREQVMARSPDQAAQAIQSMRSSPSARPSAEPSANAPAAEPSPEAASEVSASPSTSPSAPPDAAADESAPVATVQEGELAGLTLNDLAEQLSESQAMLQTVLDEREAMRAEMAGLRQEIASLTEALNASQQETQRALAAVEALEARASSPGTRTASSDAAADTPVSAAEPGIIERLEQYQWPLASVALALLLGALIWSRKRRERQWEDAPAPAGVAADVTPSKRTDADASSSASATAQPVTPEASLYTPPRTESAVPPSHEKTTPSEAAGAPERDETPAADDTSGDVDGDVLASAVPDEAPQAVPRQEASDEYDAGDRTTGEREVGHADESDDVYYAVAHDEDAEEDEPAVSAEDEAALEAAFLDTPEAVEEAPSSAPMPQRDEAPLTASPQVVPQDDDRAHYIDYHPPSLTGEASSDEWEAQSPDRPSASASASERNAATQPSREPEEEWEIEEVAFEPRRRDNGEPSKTSK